jgi:hypothetical protein
MEVFMRTVKWLMAAGLVAVTAGCVESAGYPNSSYNNSGYNSGYNNAYNSGNNSGYYANNGQYYSGSNSGYSNSNPFYSPTAARAARQPNRDTDRDGVPNRYDRDANGDRIPDAFQR